MYKLKLAFVFLTWWWLCMVSSWALIYLFDVMANGTHLEIVIFSTVVAEVSTAIAWSEMQTFKVNKYLFPGSN